MIETRKNEIRFTTSDLKRMRNKFLSKRIARIWTEDFINEENGETVSIERSEIILSKGTLLDDDRLQTVQFHLEAGDIKEVEVSNQCRLAEENKTNYLRPWIIQVDVDAKKCKFLMYASGIDNALLIVKDYIELNYTSNFTILMAKEFESCIILTDSLKSKKTETDKDLFEKQENEEEQEEDSVSGKKFYQIEVKIKWEDEGETDGLFVVHTFDIDRAMMLIQSYLQKKEEGYYFDAIKNGRVYDKREFHVSIEKAAPVQIGRFIPKEFSFAYKEEA